jgi:hypothetical protein
MRITKEEIEEALEAMTKTVHRLRLMSPKG